MKETKNNKIKPIDIWLFILVGTLFVVATPFFYAFFGLILIVFEMMLATTFGIMMTLLIISLPTLLFIPLLYSAYRILKISMGKRYQELTTNQ